jgi:hypothetical protein
MAKRLQVTLAEDDYCEIECIARSHGMSVAEWVRQALAAALEQQVLDDTARKLEAIRTAAKYVSPAGDIESMLAEIQRGYQH